MDHRFSSLRVPRAGAAIPIAAAMALLLAWPAGPGPFAGRRAAKETKPAEEPRGPSVHLTVTPRNAFSPGTFTFSGHLDGARPDDEQFCHPGVEWESRTPNGVVVTSIEDPKCLHPPEQISVPTEFTKVVTLSRPGTYVYRLILHRRDGEKILSNTQEIRVLEAH